MVKRVPPDDDERDGGQIVPKSHPAPSRPVPPPGKRTRRNPDYQPVQRDTPEKGSSPKKGDSATIGRSSTKKKREK